jgi:peptidoglycan/xylan/chitin deacetylase (PgdA/CDA1 family)
MSRNIRLSTFAIGVITSAIAFAQAPAREVAVTFDDLPIAGVVAHDAAESRAITSRLLAAVKAHGVPAIGFVNEGKLGAEGEASLKMWLDAGFELGNHTYSHIDAHTAPVANVEADILRGETVTRRLLADGGVQPRFFRHPYLHTGRDLDTKFRLERFLDAHGYRIAPVTIDNDEYVFAAAYDRAAAAGEAALRARVAAAYVPYMDAKFEFFERNEQELFGRAIRHVLLVHANPLNAERFGDLAQMLERRGYRFITLDRALEDSAYRTPDTYVGPGGITWIHRWALTKGMPKTFYAGEPETPDWVAKAAAPPK